MNRAVPALTAVLLLTGCGSGTGAPRGEQPVAVTEVLEGLAYYYACGNEVLVLPDGRSWYPLVDQGEVEPAGYPTTTVPADDRAAGRGLVAASVVLAVVEPGPGDDTGTLRVYADGVARWESDSGRVAWLVEDEITYSWEC